MRSADAAAPPELRLRRRLERAWAEVAFVGRSNAGKSSLLNALLGDRGGGAAGEFVRTSRRPGTTSRVDLFGCGLSATPRLVLADTPGFGYSAGGRAAHRQWMREVGEYLQPPPNHHRDEPDRGAAGAAGDATFSQRRLARVIVLLDARVTAGAGLAAVDLEVLQLLDGAGLPLQAVLTKADLVSALELERAAAAAAAQLGRMQMPFPYLLAVSSKTGEGIADLQQTLLMAGRLLAR
jgi:GTP-binding protein